MTPIMMITLFTGHMLLSPATSVTQEYAGELGVVQRSNGAVAVRKSIDGFGISTVQFKTPASTNELTISQVRTKNMDNSHGNSSKYPPDGYFSIWLMEGGTEAILIGGIAHGVATELVKFINQTPKVRTIGFYSVGGRVSEAIKIRDIIRARKFDTYVYKQCLSSCTIWKSS